MPYYAAADVTVAFSEVEIILHTTAIPYWLHFPLSTITAYDAQQLQHLAQHSVEGFCFVFL